MDEKFWQMGRKQAYTRMLQVCLRELGEDLEAPVRRVAELECERQAAVVALRELCGDFGDNDWPDDLHLGDVIEKHLARHLYRNVVGAMEKAFSPKRPDIRPTDSG